MALVKCSECGRTISDQASACVGCGAPVPLPPGLINLEPARSPAPPPSRRRLVLLLIVGALLLGLGMLLGQLGHGAPAMATVSALLIIIGLCTLIVSALRLEAARRRRRETSGR